MSVGYYNRASILQLNKSRNYSLGKFVLSDLIAFLVQQKSRIVLTRVSSLRKKGTRAADENGLAAGATQSFAFGDVPPSCAWRVHQL
jgi:hypothetical protein